MDKALKIGGYVACAVAGIIVGRKTGSKSKSKKRGKDGKFKSNRTLMERAKGLFSKKPSAANAKSANSNKGKDTNGDTGEK